MAMTGDGNGDARGFELFAGRLAPFCADVGDGMRGRELVGVDGMAQAGDLFQLAAAQLKEALFKL